MRSSILAVSALPALVAASLAPAPALWNQFCSTFVPCYEGLKCEGEICAIDSSTGCAARGMVCDSVLKCCGNDVCNGGKCVDAASAASSFPTNYTQELWDKCAADHHCKAGLMCNSGACIPKDKANDVCSVTNCKNVSVPESNTNPDTCCEWQKCVMGQCHTRRAKDADEFFAYTPCTDNSSCGGDYPVCDKTGTWDHCAKAIATVSGEDIRSWTPCEDDSNCNATGSLFQVCDKTVQGWHHCSNDSSIVNLDSTCHWQACFGEENQVHNATNNVCCSGAKYCVGHSYNSKEQKYSWSSCSNKQP